MSYIPKSISIRYPRSRSKDWKKLIWHGSLKNEKDYPYITKMTVLSIVQPNKRERNSAKTTMSKIHRFCYKGTRTTRFKTQAREKLTENHPIIWTHFVDHLVVKELTFSVTSESNEATGLDKVKHWEFLQQKSTPLHKQRHPDQTIFETGKFFMPHINVANTDLVFVNTLCSHPEEFLPIFMEYQKSHPTQTKRGIIGNALCVITDKPKQQYNIKNCADFTSSILNGSEDYNSCFILNTVVNNLHSCIRYIDSLPNKFLTLICL